MLDLAVDWIIGPLGAVLAAIAAGVAAYFRGRQGGKNAERHKIIKDAQERVERGRDAVHDGRDAGDPADRLRRNDGRW